MTVSGIGSERRRQRGEAARGGSEGQQRGHQAVGDEDEVGVGWGRKGRMNFAKSSIIYEENGEKTDKKFSVFRARGVQKKNPIYKVPLFE